MENSWVREDLMKISGMKLWWYRNILRPIPASWEWWVTTAQLHLCFDDFTRQISENCPCWGGCQDPFLVSSDGFLLKLSQYMAKYWFYVIKTLCFLSRACGWHQERPWPWCHPDRKKIGIWHLETWNHHHWMPVKYCDLISVPHLGSQMQPCWATRCWSWRRSWGTSATSTCSSRTKLGKYQVWHRNQVTILDRHSMVVVTVL